MRRIYLSVLAIAATLALVGGATYALFSNPATSGPNTFATGNADLKIAIDTNKDGTKSGWGDTATPAFSEKWANLYPGWEESYWVYLKNDSSSPITLKALPKINITSYSTGFLWDEVFMEITLGNGSGSTGKYSLRSWVNNTNLYLSPVLGKGEEHGPWVVKFSIPTTAGNEIANQNINFDLVFNGIQITP